MSKVDIESTAKALDLLAGKIAEGEIQRHREWGGADVVVTARRPAPWVGGFYPEPRYVVTPHARQLSWVFYQLRDIFSDLYDSCSKIEFFGRLANAAVDYQNNCGGAEDLRHLLLAVVYEAYAMLDEFAAGSFRFLAVALGNEIAADHVAKNGQVGFHSLDEMRRFFSNKGIQV